MPHERVDVRPAAARGRHPGRHAARLLLAAGPGTAACLGCHDNGDAAAHAYLNTVTFPGATGPNEACATCHGAGKDWDVAKVHAR